MSVSNTTKLLLVDDDEFVREALTRALNNTGAFSVIPAQHGEQALEILAREPIDAMLTDLQMPTMDGLTLLGHLFERGIRIPVAVMTGQTIAPELAHRLHDYGIAATFTKPVDVGTLADELQRSLDPDTVGSIRGITLFGLLQLLEVERKTALIVVRAAGEEGRLYFVDGALAHAHMPRLEGTAAAYEILGWADPAIEIFYKRKSRRRTVTEPLQHVLMEAARWMDERGNAGGGVTDAAPPGRASGDGAPSRIEPRAVSAALHEAISVDGAIGAAVVHAPSGMTLGEIGGTATQAMELAAAVASDVVMAKLKGMAALNPGDVIEDILITLGTQYHIMIFVPGGQDLFLYAIFDREQANLGLARHRVGRIARAIAAPLRA